MQLAAAGDFLFYLGAFAVALGVLIVVHEAGHFLLARWCGVKVLRFSLGFGRPLLSWRFGRDGTELALGAFPLGGYVKMLDEREGAVAAGELHRAFNRQSVWKRFLIVLAGPVANFLLAAFIYWLLFMHGVEEPRPVLGPPAAHSLADRAGFTPGETVRRVAGKPVATWQEFRWEMLRHALERDRVGVEVINGRDEIAVRQLDLSAIDMSDLEGDILQKLGFVFHKPELPPVIGRVSPGEVAAAAGLQDGDRILAIDGRPVRHWGEVVAAIRSAAGRRLRIEADRGGATLDFVVVPEEAADRGQRIGRIGIAVRQDGSPREALFVTVSYGPLEAAGKAVAQTADTSVFSLKMLGRMIIGEISWKNLSGPVTIADYAGQSARLGLTSYINFLALISISLGVLNLLPIPVLDGGHLMYYVVEIIKGGPVSERTMEIGQQIGLVLLTMLMAFAFYNDINRLVSG